MSMQRQLNLNDGCLMSELPFYLQLRDRLVMLIKTGELPASSRLPAERELAERFSTTRVTLRQALAQLESEGQIYRSNRRGWFVSPERLNYEPVKDVSFTRYVTAQGRTPMTQVLGFEHAVASVSVAAALELLPGDPVYCLRRRRYVDERLVLVERIWLNAQYLPDLEKERFDLSLWQLFAHKYGIELTDKSISIIPTALTGEFADALEVNSGCPGLHITRISKTTSGQVVEYDEEYWLHDVLSISVSSQ